MERAMTEWGDEFDDADEAPDWEEEQEERSAGDFPAGLTGAGRVGPSEREGRSAREGRDARGGRGARERFGGRAEKRERRKLGEVDEVPPGRVTAMHERRAGSSRFVVAIEGRVAAVVSTELIADLGLKVGALIDPALAERLRAESSRLAVFDKAVDLLAVRARSTRDLQTRLRRAGAEDGAIAAAVERLQRLGFLDDEAYARNLARSRVMSGGVSKRRIGQELQRRGVSRDVADDAIADTLEEVELDEEGAARMAAEKRMRALRSYDAQTQKQRLYAFLARRGYSPDVISRVVRAVMRGASGEA